MHKPQDFPSGSVVENSSAHTRGVGSIQGSGRSPGVGNGNALQYPCLKNPTDRGAWWATVHGVAKASDMTEQLHFHFIDYRVPSTSLFPGGSEVKASTCNAGDPGSIPGSGRFPGGGHGKPLQYCLENPLDRGAWQATDLFVVTKSQD